MLVGYPSLRVDDTKAMHHLWCNNGTWWLHYTLHFDNRARRIRRSLRTRALAEAVVRRDQQLSQIAEHGEIVPDRRASRLSRAVAS